MVPCFASRYNSCKAFHLPQPESEVHVPRKAKPPMGKAKSEASTTSAIRSGETSSHVFPQFPSPVCVHKVSQVGAEQARIELQGVILEWLGAAAILAVHLAQVSQVDHVQVTRFLAESAAIRLVSMTCMTF